jgi:ubiquitin-conjugating enzyme E2 D/E
MNFGRMQGMPMMNPMGNPMMMTNPMMMNPMYNNNNMNAYQLQQMQNMMKMQQMMMQMNNQGQVDKRMARIQKEFFLCQKDSDLIQIGCSFGLEVENNFNVWKVSMLGPQNTPYAGGVFTIKVYFPQEYPNKGAEFRFVNKIYHLNVDWKNKDSLGHICLSSLNEWHTTGKVKSKPCYGVKQALFDIFCLFYNQGIDSPYDEAIAEQYKNRRSEFDALALKWTKDYA